MKLRSLHIVCIDLAVWRSTQEAEGTPLERVQVVNSGARVQIPPSPFEVPIGTFLLPKKNPATFTILLFT